MVDKALNVFALRYFNLFDIVYSPLPGAELQTVTLQTLSGAVCPVFAQFGLRTSIHVPVQLSKLFLCSGFCKTRIPTLSFFPCCFYEGACSAVPSPKPYVLTSRQ